MKFTACILIGIMLLLSIPVAAGPMTGAPTISYGEGIDGMGLTTRTGTVGLGFSTFEFRAKAGTVTASGPIVSGEYNIPIGDTDDKSLSLGAWLATLGDEGVGSLGELHARYGLTRSWGFELGIPVADTKDLIGLMYHVVYQPNPSADGKLSTQFGIGSAQKAKDGSWFEASTNVSAFANMSYILSDTVSANLSLWFLKQKFHWQEDDNDPNSWKNADLSSMKWSLSAGYKF